MKKMFRKAVTVLGSTALIGATVAMAAAASYPEPFTSNAAIVVGANAAPSDNIAAASIASNLDANAVSTGTTVISSDGDSFKFEKTSTKFWLGNTITGTVSSDLDEDQMPNLLADGVYVDDDNDEFDFTQKIVMTTSQLTMFDDNDYKTDEPTVGFKFASGADVLTYTLTFSDEPLINDTVSTDLTIMGKDYYVLAATHSKLTLLDSAADALVTEGETATITAGGKTYTVSIEFVDSNSAKLNVNGEITNDISTTETYKLSDGSYLGMKEILYSAKDTGISKVEFSIGSGKLVLENGQDIKVNDDSVDGMTSTITNSTSATKYTSIAIDWNTEDEVFVAEDSIATMPVFETVSLSFTGLDYPTEEQIEIGYDGDSSAALKDFPLKDSVEDINLLYTNATGDYFFGLGKDADEKLVTGASSITFDGDTDAYFVASWADTRDSESYLMRATNFNVDNDVNKTTFQYRKDGAWVDAKVDRANATTFTLGNVDIAVGAIDKLGKSVAITNNSVGTNFNTLYSKEGLKVNLPTTTPTDVGYINLTGAQNSSYVLAMEEENKDGDLGSGDDINVTFGFAGTTPKDVSVTAVTTTNADATSSEIGSSDVYRDFTYSALATEILFDQGGDQDFVTLVYHGDEVAAGVYLTSSDAVMSSGDAGVMTVMDNAVSSVAGKNLVVVGGSAINSVAAELLGGAYSEAMFTTATDVSAGEFLIQAFNRNGKIALLVAGYNAADTEKAVTYLLNNDVDTTVGKKMIGTSATEASLVTA